MVMIIINEARLMETGWRCWICITAQVAWKVAWVGVWQDNFSKITAERLSMWKHNQS